MLALWQSVKHFSPSYNKFKRKVVWRCWFFFNSKTKIKKMLLVSYTCLKSVGENEAKSFSFAVNWCSPAKVKVTKSVIKWQQWIVPTTVSMAVQENLVEKSMPCKTSWPIPASWRARRTFDWLHRSLHHPYESNILQQSKLKSFWKIPVQLYISYWH